MPVIVLPPAFKELDDAVKAFEEMVDDMEADPLRKDRGRYVRERIEVGLALGDQNPSIQKFVEKLADVFENNPKAAAALATILLIA